MSLIYTAIAFFNKLDMTATVIGMSFFAALDIFILVTVLLSGAHG